MMQEIYSTSKSLKTQPIDTLINQEKIDFNINLTIQTSIAKLYQLDAEGIKFSFDTGIPTNTKVFKLTLIGWKFKQLMAI